MPADITQGFYDAMLELERLYETRSHYRTHEQQVRLQYELGSITELYETGEYREAKLVVKDLHKEARDESDDDLSVLLEDLSRAITRKRQSDAQREGVEARLR